MTRFPKTSVIPSERSERGNLLLCGAIFVQADSHGTSRIYNVNRCEAKMTSQQEIATGLPALAMTR